MADKGKTNDEMSGTERAAIFLLALGEQDAAEVFKYMGPKEVQKVSMTMTSMEAVTRGNVAAVLSEFRGAVDNETALGVGTADLALREANDILEQRVWERTEALHKLAYYDPVTHLPNRLKLMDEQGVEASIMIPTLAVGVEHQLRQRRRTLWRRRPI